jgi:hypothetical protein
VSNSPQQPNTIGNTSLILILGIVSLAVVFGIGLCALVGARQGWIALAGTPLFVCGASSAFLGFLSAALGLAGLFGANRPRAAAIVGLVLGLAGMCVSVPRGSGCCGWQLTAVADAAFGLCQAHRRGQAGTVYAPPLVPRPGRAALYK